MKFGLSDQAIAKINTVLASYPEVDAAILYGSRAKDTYKPGSDIDLVLKGEAITLTQQLEIENLLDDLLLPYKIDLSILKRIENPDLISHIERVGKMFYLKTA